MEKLNTVTAMTETVDTKQNPLLLTANVTEGNSELATTKHSIASDIVSKEPQNVNLSEHLEDFKNRNVWVCWKNETFQDGKKTKIPYNANNGEKARSNDTSTWCDYKTADTAYNHYEKYDGIGFMFADGFGGIDIDDHHSEQQQGNKNANEILELFKGTYIERSPSGNGYHIIFKVDKDSVPVDENGKWNDEFYKKNPHNELECYIGGFTNRYFTFTGNKCSNGEYITDQTEQFLIFLSKHMRKSDFQKKQEKQSNCNLSVATPKNLSIDDILQKAREAKNGYKFCALYDYGDISSYNNDDSSADLALCNILAFWLYNYGGEQAIDYAFRQSKLYRDDKWGKRADYRNSTISKAISMCDGKFYDQNQKPNKPEMRNTTQDKNNNNGKKSKPYFKIESLESELKKLEYEVKFNQMDNSINFFKSKGIMSNQEANDIPTLLFSDLCDKYTGIRLDYVGKYLNVIAKRNKYNPVLDLFNANQWDKQDHLTKVYDVLGIAEDDVLSRTLLLKWFWQGHALLRNNEVNPFGADGVLVLTGEQGIGKTSFFRQMAIKSEFFRDGQKINGKDKDTARRCITTWIAELGELDATFGSAQISDLKAFITKALDEYRLPYASKDEQAARRANLAATVNVKKGDGFLVDTTGNRRFWTVPVQEINLVKLSEIDALQVWLQVWEQHAKNNLQGFRLTYEEREQLNKRNRRYERRIKAEDEILDILENARNRNLLFEYMTVTKFKEGHNSLKNYSVRQISIALDKIGIEQERKSIDGKQDRYRLLPTEFIKSDDFKNL